jgi:hypothetical protein
MIFFKEIKKNSGNNIDSSYQKCPFVKKSNLNDLFHARKGHFAPGKRALGKTWRAWPPLAPRFLRPWFGEILPSVMIFRRFGEILPSVIIFPSGLNIIISGNISPNLPRSRSINDK